MATGGHRKLLNLTRDYHRKYACRYGIAYLEHSTNRSFPKRAGWGKIPLILEAFSSGFERIIWLDADTVIVDPEVNLALGIESGIGMVRFKTQSPHWNSGVMVIRRCPRVIEFFEQVHHAPENDHWWMEQLPINEFAALPKYASIIHEMDAAYNCHWEAPSDRPIVLAAHGYPMVQRYGLMARWMTGVEQIQNDGTYPNSNALCARA